MASYHLKPGKTAGSKRKGRQPSPQVAKQKAARSKPYTDADELAYEECGCDAIFGKGLKTPKPITPEEKLRQRYARKANSLEGGYKHGFCTIHGIALSAAGKCLSCDAAEAKAQHPQCPLGDHPRPRHKPKPKKPPSRKKKKQPRRAVTLRAGNVPPARHSDGFPRHRRMTSAATNGQ